MRARLTSSRFVGRVSELAELELALREAADGYPTVVLVGGESGVGKTRLVSELQRRLAESEQTALVLRVTLPGEGPSATTNSISGSAHSVELKSPLSVAAKIDRTRSRAADAIDPLSRFRYPR